MSRESPPSLVYHELDFPANTQRKIAAITGSSALTGLVSQPFTLADNDTSLYSSTLNVHPIDLRDLRSPTDEGVQPPKLEHVDASLPTLLISECCLIYLPPSAADQVVRYFSAHVFPATTPLALLLYEPINPHDSFGRVMVSNLASRGIVLQTLHKYSSLEAQKERLRMLGFGSEQRAADVDYIWDNWVGEDEKERVAALEMMDEVEEWKMLAKHYCISWGWRDGIDDPDGHGSPWQRWRALPNQ